MMIPWCQFCLILLLFALKETSVDATSSSSQAWPSISSLPPAQYNLFRLFSGGITDVFWNDDADANNFTGINIGKECMTSMTALSEHLEQRSEWAFRGKSFILFTRIFFNT